MAKQITRRAGSGRDAGASRAAAFKTGTDDGAFKVTRESSKKRAAERAEAMRKRLDGKKGTLPHGL